VARVLPFPKTAHQQEVERQEQLAREQRFKNRLAQAGELAAERIAARSPERLKATPAATPYVN
jgi:hypothetical protein